MNTAKEYLRQLWQLDREIEIKYRDLEELRASIGIRAMPDPDQNIGHSGGTSDPVSDMAIKIVKLEKYINKRLDKLIDLRVKITTQIDGMENRNHRNILTCRYVLMQSWDDVADSMGYSVQNCYLIHGQALQAFYKQYLQKD